MKVDANFLKQFIEMKVDVKKALTQPTNDNPNSYLFDVPPDSGDDEPLVVLSGAGTSAGTRAGSNVKTAPVDNRTPYEKIQDLGLSDEVLSEYFDDKGDLNEGYSNFKDLGPGSETKIVNGFNMETGEETTFDLHRSWQKHFSITQKKDDGTTREINFYVDDKGNTTVDDTENKALMDVAANNSDQPITETEMSPGQIKHNAVEQMKEKGYTQDMLNEYFDYVSEGKNAGFVLKPQYSSVSDMGNGKDTKGEYDHRFVFTRSDNKDAFEEVKIYSDGTISTTSLARQKNDKTKQNDNSNAAFNPETLKEMGLSDAIIAKYFNQEIGTSDGTYVKLGNGYTDMKNKGPGKDPVTGEDCKNVIVFTKEYENGQKELEYVYIHADGTNVSRGVGNSLTTNESQKYQEDQKNALINQGYTPEMIDKYFEYMMNQATGKGGYSLNPEYKSVIDHGEGIDSDGKEYTHKFVFGLKDDPNGGAEEVIVYKDGTTSVSKMVPMKADNVAGGFRGGNTTEVLPGNFFSKFLR